MRGSSPKRCRASASTSRRRRRRFSATCCARARARRARRRRRDRRGRARRARRHAGHGSSKARRRTSRSRPPTTCRSPKRSPRRRSAAAPRCRATGRAGTGYDLHRLVAGRPLILGGVTIPSDRGALGHSDADVVCHAVTDAILGAAALGDIGRHFPDTDPRWKGAVERGSAATRGRSSSRERGIRGRQRGRHGDPRAPEDSRATSTRCARSSPARSASTSTG